MAARNDATPPHHRNLANALSPDHFPRPEKTPRYHARIIGEGGKASFRRNTPKRRGGRNAPPDDMKTPRYQTRIIGDDGGHSFRRNTPKRPRKKKNPLSDPPPETAAQAEGTGLGTLLKISSLS